MTHFTLVAAVKDNSNNALTNVLQPYHTFECDEVEDEYVKFVPCGDEKVLRKLHREYLIDEPDETPEVFSWFINYFDGYTLNENGVIGKLTNPNAKWDDWSLEQQNGFIDKYGEKMKRCQISHIDFDAMKNESLYINAFLYNNEWIDLDKSNLNQNIQLSVDEFKKIIKQVPKEYYLVLVDCHR